MPEQQTNDIHDKDEDGMTDLPTARVVGGDTIEPNPGGVIKAFARIGYKLPEAVADIVDNSIDAGAKNVLIRFYCSDDQIRRVAIVDDGAGMDDDSLAEAMKFGADIAHAATDLGKFGIGLKSASFSQCRSLSVLSMHGGAVTARRWTIEGIRDGWKSERLHPDDARAILASRWGDVRIRKHGTAVVWDELDRLKIAPGGVDPALRAVFSQIRLALGIVYHRFISRGAISIKVDALKYGQRAGIAQPIDPIDPFAYETSGHKHYPKTFRVKLGASELKLDAHIWPPKSKGPEYSLGGTAAARQGFYFYRNDRLIQRGGWNKLREHETDPHLSLSRVVIDLPSEFDSLFNLDVQKSSVDVPPGFDAAVRASKCGGVTWSDYIRDAETAYRRGERNAPENAPIVMGGGVPSGVRSRARRVLAPNEKRQRKIRIKWAALGPDVFFEIDRQNHVIKINKTYRKRVTSGGRQSNDAAIVKTLIFLLVRDEFNRERVRQNVHQWIDNCNQMLVAAVAGS